jgi:Ca2+-binding RTX toxin-like protein
MQRMFLLTTLMAVSLLVIASGLALAVSKSGGDRDDVIKGTPDRDSLSGGGGDDRLYGREQRDRVYGDSGADEAYGGRGPDQLFGGQGPDIVFGGPGDDFINVVDERKDTVIDCGAGDFDEVYGDAEDFEGTNLENCEHINLITIEPASAAGITPERLTPQTLPEEGVTLERISP